MGKITIVSETTKRPITFIGEMAGYTTKADTSNPEKNYKRGLDCIQQDHGRTLEFPNVVIRMEGYSARVIREWYTHIGCLPSRLQESTRYVDMSSFGYIVPPSISNNEEAIEYYNNCISEITNTYTALLDIGIPKEDAAMVLPLGMETTIVDKRNLRNIIDMCHNRLCSRAYWEYRELLKDLFKALSEYSDEWKYLVETQMKRKCEYLGYCNEKKSCGYISTKRELEEDIK